MQSFCGITELMKKYNYQEYYTPYQLKFPDPAYTFCEVMDYIDLKAYLGVKKAEQVAKDIIRISC